MIDLLLKNLKNQEIFGGISSKLPKKISVSLSESLTVSKMKEVVKSQSPETIIIQSLLPGNFDSDLCIDLAVSFNAEYIQIGWPSRAENIRAFRRFYELSNVKGLV